MIRKIVIKFRQKLKNSIEVLYQHNLVYFNKAINILLSDTAEDDIERIEFYNLNPCFINKIRDYCYKDGKFNKRVIIRTQDNRNRYKAECQKCQFYKSSCKGIVDNFAEESVTSIDRRYIDINSHIEHMKVLRRLSGISFNKELGIFENRVISYLQQIQNIQSFPIEYSFSIAFKERRLQVYRYVLGILPYIYKDFQQTIDYFFKGIVDENKISQIKEYCTKHSMSDWQMIVGIAIDVFAPPVYKIYLRRLDNKNKEYYIIRYGLNRSSKGIPIGYYFLKDIESTKRIINNFGLGTNNFIFYNNVELKDIIIAYKSNPKRKPDSVHIPAFKNNIWIDDIRDFIPDYIINTFKNSKFILSYLAFYKNLDKANIYYLL